MTTRTSRSLICVFSSTALAVATFAACNSPKVTGLGNPDAAADAADDGYPCGFGNSVFDAGTLDDAQVALGYTLVHQLEAGVAGLGCPTCHGPDLQGNINGYPAPSDEGGVAFPPNLTPDPHTGLGCWSRDQIVRAVLHGMNNQGDYLCPPMPRWGTYGLTDAGAYAIAEYLESLPPYDNGEILNEQTVCATPPGWPDASTGEPDAAPPPSKDAGTDSTAADANDEDAGVDSGEDAAPDAALDGGSDASSDAESDAGDASGADAAVDSAGQDSGSDAARDSGAVDADEDASDGGADDAGIADASDAG